MIHVPVAVEPRPYEVLVGPGARRELAEVVSRVAPDAARAVVVTQEPLVDAGWIAEIALGVPAEVVLIEQGEDAKNLQAIERLCRRFVEIGLSRQDLVVAVGGGLTSDVAGFAAATYHRGITYLTVATTLWRLIAGAKLHCASWRCASAARASAARASRSAWYSEMRWVSPANPCMPAAAQ